MKAKLNLRYTRLVIIACLAIFLAGLTGFWLGTHDFKIKFGPNPSLKVERKIPVDKQNIDFSLFWEVWDRLETNYIDKKALDQNQMILGAIQGMVASLGDPYTVFLKPPENKEIKEDLNGAFEGVGIQLGFKENQLAVIAPLTGTPAYKAGVSAFGSTGPPLPTWPIKSRLLW